MAVLLETHPRFAGHDVGRGHPERPARLQAVLDGISAAALDDLVVPVTPRPATTAELALVHTTDWLERLAVFCADGGGALDPDTAAVAASWEAAILGAGAGLDAVERLRRGEADAAFCAVRPPGHHALPDRAMGFCLLNNIAITAMALADRGERVLIVDFDAHHGNGTQDVFYADARVAYVSMHEYPLYPGTGRLEEAGAGAGEGMTLNVPFPAGTTGDAYLAALDEVVAPMADSFDPTWVLASAGFDGHRADPLTGLGLSAGDFADITARVMAYAPPGRRIAFLEGGYDLDALGASAGSCVAAMAGVEHRPERSTSGGAGAAVVVAAREERRRWS